MYAKTSFTATPEQLENRQTLEWTQNALVQLTKQDTHQVGHFFKWTRPSAKLRERSWRGYSSARTLRSATHVGWQGRRLDFGRNKLEKRKCERFVRRVWTGLHGGHFSVGKNATSQDWQLQSETTFCLPDCPETNNRATALQIHGQIRFRFGRGYLNSTLICHRLLRIYHRRRLLRIYWH